MTIKKKLIIYFLIIFVVFSAFSIYSTYYSISVNKQINQGIIESASLIKSSSAHNIIAQLIRYDDEVLTQSARNYAFTGDKKWRDRYFEFVPKLDLRIEEALKSGDEEDKKIFDNISSANIALIVLEKKAIDYVDNKNLISAEKVLESEEYWNQKNIYKTGLEKYLLHTGSEIDSVDSSFIQALEDFRSYLDRISKIQTYFILGLIFLFLVTVLFLFYLIFKMFMSPLLIFKKTARKIIDGNLEAKVEITNKDEIGDFAIDFNKMTGKLKDSLENIKLKVAEQTKEIEEKAKELGNQKSAVLNILEDVEREKNKTELLAHDLEKFKLAVDNASDQVVITDIEGIVIYGNRAVEKITGFKPEEALGKKAGALWKVPMPTEYYKNMWDIIKNKKEIFVSEIQNKRKNGEIYTANISISPVINEDGAILFFVAIEHDITKEKEVDKAKTEFVSLASHQLRTPLSSINWYTEMLLAGDAGEINEEQKKYLNEVAIGNKRMVELVDSLLNVSRLDLGTFIIEPEPTNIIEMMKSVVGELQPLIKEKKIKLEELYKENISEFSADKKLLRIVFQNLLSNAVKYTPNDGAVKVELEVVLKDKEFGGKEMKEDSLTIKVSDTGMGVPADQKDKIFLKLFRADNARESETEGTGLGLYIIKSIIDQSGGSVWFESEEGKGSTFYVCFSINGMKKKEGTKKLD